MLRKEDLLTPALVDAIIFHMAKSLSAREIDPTTSSVIRELWDFRAIMLGLDALDYNEASDSMIDALDFTRKAHTRVTKMKGEVRLLPKEEQEGMVLEALELLNSVRERMLTAQETAEVYV